MDNLLEKVSKFVSDNPKIILILIVALIIVIIWLYFKSRNMFSGFSTKKDKLKKNKIKSKVSDSEDESDTHKENSSKKNAPDPIVAQLVKDINQNS